MKRWQYEPARDHGLGRRERLRSPRRERGPAGTFVLHVASSALHLYLAGEQHLHVWGREKLPSKLPFVLVANHCSHLDALALAAVVRWSMRDRLFPIAAGDTFFESTATAHVAALLLNALPVWRGRCGGHALSDLRRRLVEEPCGYILFPEGTRSRDGRMGAFKPGVGMLVAGVDVPVVPCSLRGTFDAWPPQRRLPRPGRVSVRIGDPLVFGDVGNDRVGWEHVTARLEAEVRRLCPQAAAAGGQASRATASRRRRAAPSRRPRR